MQLVGLPDPATVPALFEHATEPAERIERLVREAFAISERGARSCARSAARRADTRASPRTATSSRRR
jgi:hypothetical protein